MLRLVKTIGGHGGAPSKCMMCESTHFVKAGISWCCANCASYVCTNFSDPSAIDNLRRDMDALTETHSQFKDAIDELEKMVTE